MTGLDLHLYILKAVGLGANAHPLALYDSAHLVLNHQEGEILWRAASNIAIAIRLILTVPE